MTLRWLLATAAAAAIGFTAAGAEAATDLGVNGNTTATFTELGSAPFMPAGYTDITQFTSPAPASAAATALATSGGLSLTDATTDGVLTIPGGYSLTGTALVEQGSWVNISAAPGDTGGQDTAPYLSVQAGLTAALWLPSGGVHHLSIYIGSLDSYNDLVFTYADGKQDFLTGNDLAGIIPPNDHVDNGDWTSGSSNGLYVFNFDSALTGVSLSSNTNAFEIANIAAAVPEPSTWTMLLLGFFGLGALLRHRRGRVALAA